MLIIKKLSEMIGEEIADAGKYARCAMQYKTEQPALSDLFYRLSTDEMQHMALLHEEVQRLIADYRKQNGEPPAPMMAVYDYLHEQHIENAAEVKAMQAMYKGV